jgi:hypothetical protein
VTSGGFSPERLTQVQDVLSRNFDAGYVRVRSLSSLATARYPCRTAGPDGQLRAPPERC